MKVQDQTIPKDYSILKMTILEDEILEAGVIKVRNNYSIAKYIGHIKPNKEINEQALKSINIKDKEIVENAEDLDIIIPRIMNIIGNDTLIYLNTDKQLELLKSKCESLGIQIKNDTIYGNKLLLDIPRDIKCIISNSLEILVLF